MDQLDLTPAELAEMRELLRERRLENANIKRAAMVPPDAVKLGPVGRFMAWRGYALGALTVLLIPADIRQAVDMYAPSVVKTCNGVVELSKSMLSHPLGPHSPLNRTSDVTPTTNTTTPPPFDSEASFPYLVSSPSPSSPESDQSGYSLDEDDAESDNSSLA